MRRLVVLLTLLAATAVGAAEALPDPAPLFQARLTGLDGKPAPFAGYRGRPLVVNFWARWCEPCRREIPQLLDKRRKFKERGLEVVGIAIDDKADSVRDFAQAYGMDYPVLLAGDQGVGLLQALGNPAAGLPYTLVIDRQGKVVARSLGPLKEAEMESAFRRALQ